MKIVIDFDGTVVTHEYPFIGKNIGAIPVLKKLVEHGHQLILFTMRSGTFLNDAVKWFNDNGIQLYGVQTDPDQKEWTDSPKAYGQLIIDDAALGCPLITNIDYSLRPYADWEEIELLLTLKGLYK